MVGATLHVFCFASASMSSLIRPPLPLLLCATIFALATAGASWWHWWTFQYGTFDLAFYVQALWLALRGEWLVSLLNVPLLGNHAEPIVFLLTPLFALWPHPMLLVSAQVLALATMPFTGRRIALRLGFSPRDATLLGAVLLLLPATAFVAIHEFHPEAFAAPLLLLLIEARTAGRLRLFWLWFLGALACKENIALLLVGFCSVHLLLDRARGRRGQLWWNAAPLAVALAWLVIYGRVLGPRLNGGNVAYLELYSHLGATGGEILHNFWAEPARILHAFWRALTGGNLVWAMLLPLLGLPLLRPRWLLIAAPIVLQHLLSLRPVEWSIDLHYAAPLIPLCWMAAAEAARKLPRQPAIVLSVFVACCIAQFWVGPARALAALPDFRGQLWERSWKADLLAPIAADRSLAVTASQPFLSHLATRRELHSLHHILKGLKTLSREEMPAPPPGDAVVIDFADETTFSAEAGYYHPAMRLSNGRIVPSSDQLLADFLAPAQWTQSAVNAVTVLRRSASHGDSRTSGAGSEIVPGLVLQALDFSVPSPGKNTLFSLRWRITGQRPTTPWMLLVLSDGTQLRTIPAGECAVGAGFGESVTTWEVRLPPDFPAANYDCFALFYDHTQAAWTGRMPPADPKFTLRTIALGHRPLAPSEAAPLARAD